MSKIGISSSPLKKIGGREGAFPMKV